jgi:hypothetical protein
MTRYVRDNSQFREYIAGRHEILYHKPEPARQSLSIWQTCIIGLVVTVVKVWFILSAWFGGRVAAE